MSFAYCPYVETNIILGTVKCFKMEFEDSQLWQFEYLPADKYVRYGNTNQFLEVERDELFYFDLKARIQNDSELFEHKGY